MIEPGSPIRVMIVEDEAVVRLLLEEIIGRDPRLEVVASVGSGEAALCALPKAQPNVISLDIRLPGMDGFEFTRAVMTQQPTPIVVVSANTENDDLRISMNALSAGALAVVEKPVGVLNPKHEAFAASLCRQLVLMSDVPLIRQRPPISRPSSMENVPAPRHIQADRPLRSVPPAAPGRFRLLGLVASTGGPNALVEILRCLSPGFPLPIALVQHMTPSFLQGFVGWLSDATGFKTLIVKDNHDLVPGVIHVAPPDRHLEIRGDRAWATDSPSVASQRPSGTVLFSSMAESVGHRSIGVLLTGMGEDGAEGMLSLHRRGGYTIAEDQSTAVVFGMPRVAAELEAVDEQLPLPRIGPRINELAIARRMVS